MKKKDSVIIVVNYRCPGFVYDQVRRIEKYMGPSSIFVADTSNDADISMSIAAEVKKTSASYYRMGLNGMYDYDVHNPSYNHATALNTMYEYCRNDYKIVCMMDHDTFPYKKTDIWRHVSGYAMCGIGQVRGEVEYLLPNMMFINTDKYGGSLDFLPAKGTDTGGRIAEVLKKLSDQGLVGSLEYAVLTHPGEPGSTYSSEIIEGCMHYIKGSNWNREDELSYNKRIATLKKYLISISE